MKLRRRGLTVAALVATVSVPVGAWAAIPALDGTISACVQNNRGSARIIDVEAGDRCGAAETPLTWNQRGPEGPEGPRGLQGPQGVPGIANPTQAVGSATIPAGEIRQVVATCPPGSVALGGGFAVPPGGVQVLSSEPTSTGQGWRLFVSNPDSGPTVVGVSAYAVCAQVAS